jgi:tetratricopeptide (TPR) repeat protein
MRNNAHDIFISYAHQDDECAKAICGALETAKLRCWIAPRDVKPGTAYAQALVDAIGASRMLLVVFSADANASAAVLNELEIAFHRKIPILPVRLGPIEPDGSAEFYLRRWQWFEMPTVTPPRIDELVKTARDTLSPPSRKSRPERRKASDAVSQPPLIGRESELAAISARLTAASRGDGSLVIVSGEPGAGKTRLMSAVVDAARAGAFRVASAVNFEHARSPLGPWVDILKALESTIREIVPPNATDRAMFDRLLSPTADQQSPLDKRRLFVIIAEALERAAKRAPLLICFDDAQWLDPESIELVDFLGSRIERARIVVLLATRSAESGPIPTAISRLEFYGATTLVDVAPLSEQEVRDLVASVMPLHQISAGTFIEIVHRSDGNPLFAVELARSANSQAAQSLMPRSVKLSVVERTAKFTPTVLRVLEAAAVFGRAFPLNALTTVAEVDEKTAVGAMRCAKDAGLIEEARAGKNDFLFRHELFRAAIYDSLLAAERPEVHRRVANVLSGDERASSALLAYHWRMAGEREKSALFSQRAGDEAMTLGASASAREHYMTALTFDVYSDADAAALKEKIAIACNEIGDSAAAAKYFEDGAALLRGLGRPHEAARLELRFASNAYRSGRSEEVVQACERCLASSNEPDIRYGANAILASFYAYRGDIDVATKHIAEADASVVTSAVLDRLSIEWARVAIANAVGDDGWLEPSRKAVELAEQSGRPALLALNLMNCAFCRSRHGPNEDATAMYERAIHIADESGSTYTSAYARGLYAIDCRLRGRLDDAKRAFVEATALHVDALVVRTMLASICLTVHADTGDLKQVADGMDAALLDAAFTTGEDFRFVGLAAAHVHAAALSGDLDRARAITARVLSALRTFNSVASSLFPLVFFGSTDDVETIGRLLADAPAVRKITLDREMIEAVVAVRTGREDGFRLAMGALEMARSSDALLYQAYALELLNRVADAQQIYRQIGAQGHLERLA